MASPTVTLNNGKSFPLVGLGKHHIHNSYQKNSEIINYFLPEGTWNVSIKYY